MDYTVLKTGFVALSPQVTKRREAGDTVSIVDGGHAAYLIDKGVIGKQDQSKAKKKAAKAED